MKNRCPTEIAARSIATDDIGAPKILTIIDLLQRENLEFFDSSILAWLLNDEIEHGLKTSVLRGLVEELILQGYPELKNAVETLQYGGGEIKIEAHWT